MALLRIILWAWQFPQVLLGLLLRLRWKGRKTSYRGVTYIVGGGIRGGLSLAATVFIQYDEVLAPKEWAHEYGHTRQSLYLGPLYLLVIGIPSALWALTHETRDPRYFDFYTEKWADKLGNVKR